MGIARLCPHVYLTAPFCQYENCHGIHHLVTPWEKEKQHPRKTEVHLENDASC